MKILADDKIPFLKGVLENHCSVDYLPASEITRQVVINPEVEALIIRTRTRCDAELLEGTNIRFIATATIGFDHIDTSYCAANNIVWSNAVGCNSWSVNQYITAALLYLARTNAFSISDMTLGVVGVGNVGKKIARTAKILGMKVLLNDPPRARQEDPYHFVSLDRLIDQSNIITLHVPLNKYGEDKTYHLVDKEFIDKVKRETFLINTSRGEVIETPVLKQALISRKISGAVLDVFEHEPDIDTELLDCLQVATPHIAGYTVEGKAKGTAMSVRAVSRFFNFGLDDWFPDDLPAPPDPVIRIHCNGKTYQQVILEAVKETYDIEADDRRLRQSPHTFEKQRNDYPVRREVPAFTVQLKNDSDDLADILKKLGFNIANRI